LVAAHVALRRSANEVKNRGVMVKLRLTSSAKIVGRTLSLWMSGD
jgi:hypothetical protein